MAVAVKIVTRDILWTHQEHVQYSIRSVKVITSATVSAQTVIRAIDLAVGNVNLQIQIQATQIHSV